MRLSRHDWALIGVAALLLTLAYPPYALVVLPFVCLVPAALLILRGCDDDEPFRRHLHQGFWYGAITQVVLLHWLAGALWRYHPTAVFLFGVTAATFGSATAVLFGLVGRIARTSSRRLIVSLPAGVVALEWIAEQVGPIAFPWHRVALTVTAHPVLTQAADLLGSAGLGYLIVTVNACFALAWWTKRSPRVAVRHLETGAALLLLMSLYGCHRVATLPLEPRGTIAVVQPNVQWDEKWRPEEADAIVARTVRLTEMAVEYGSPELVLWPETALPGVLAHHSEWLVRVSRLAVVTGTTLLVGAMDEERGPNRSTTPGNALFSISPLIGAGPEVAHRKRRLVPVVERSLSRLAGSDSDTRDDLQVQDGPVGRYGALICFEITFESLARRLGQMGARVLVTVSNDAWLGRTSGPHQHFAHAVLRAVENRVAVVRSANTGVSGIVDPLGRVVARTDPFTETYVVGQIQQTQTVPPAIYLGGAAGPAAFGLLLVMLLVSVTRAGTATMTRSRSTFD